MKIIPFNVNDTNLSVLVQTHTNTNIIIMERVVDKLELEHQIHFKKNNASMGWHENVLGSTVCTIRHKTFLMSNDKLFREKQQTFQKEFFTLFYN